MKKFLIVVDTQVDFMMPSGALYVGAAEQIIIPGIEFLASLRPEDYAGVLFTADTHYRETYFDLPESREFPIHCVSGEAGHKNVFNNMLVDGNIDDFYLTKGVFSMWEEESITIFHPRMAGDVDASEETPRDVFFNDLKARGIDTVQVMGVATDYCVKWAVDGLVERGFKVEVIQELCRGIAQPANDVFEGVPGYESVSLI